MNVDQTNFILLDSAGSYSPVKGTCYLVQRRARSRGPTVCARGAVENELSVAQKEATELFLLDLIFDLSD